MRRNVEILEKQEVFKQFVFRIVQAKFRHELFNGAMSEPLTRMSFERGDSVAALVHEIDSDNFLFTDQFRYPTYEKGPGWILEIPAGIVNPNEDYEEAIRREIQEEIGYETPELQTIGSVYMSPGGSSERIHIFYARVQSSHATSTGGGLASEGENIRRVKIPANEAYAQAARGEIFDAKTLVAIQWWKINIADLPLQ